MDALGILRKHENAMIELFSVRKMGIFGSFAKGQERKNSDIDILVEFREGQKTFGNYMDLKFYLEDSLKEKWTLLLRLP
ncbi:MAG: nucleotidyltransferase domain-containing protein [Methanolobus sp.]|uniref:nucleotidyltransferase family protein n=1 Tax=Methanolobus sp. TaxID=1874737 RepID=UPI00272FF52C|nr:nucleotidyltransferase domain-containing protein [Methanolobus sp.]MDP2217144.1 nucleotidyltransferase domain-containing protein [Methanolobus sp.]